jgi:arginyl-tRNA synthetase
MPLDKIREHLAQVLEIDKNDLVYPSFSHLGDLSLPLFKFTQEKKLSLEDLALSWRDKIIQDSKLKNIVSKVEILKAYLNIFIKTEYLSSLVLERINKEKDGYGFNDSGQGDLSIFEFSNVNTHKDFHIGHLRNVVLGNSFCQIFLANGFKSYPISYINDFGIHTAKTIWSYRQNPNSDLGASYAQTSQKMEEDPSIAEEVGSIMTDIEKRQGENYRFWKKTREISLKNFQNVYDFLNIKFKKTYFESQIIGAGLKMSQELLERGILKKSQGAIIADLEEYQLGVLPIIRSDHTALYPVADLALAAQKFNDFKNLKNSYVVVDNRQSLYFKQLFKILELAGYQENFTHLSYEFVTLPEGLMSSRSGNAVSFFDLYQQVLDRLIEETKKRHPEWSEKKISQNCQRLAVAVLKFEMLKVSPNKIITFDIKEALKFEGFSALYILYGLVRVKSILRKGGFKIKGDFDFSLLEHDLEKEILLKLAKYPEIVLKTKESLDPSEIAKYLLELFRTFNDYYQKVKILSSSPEIKKVRFFFLQTIIQVAENALSLLGLESLDEI